MIDGVTFFKTYLKPFAFFGDNQFFYRLKMRQWWKYRNICWADFLRLFLPGVFVDDFFRERVKEMEKFSVEEIFVNNRLYDEGITLFGRVFVPAKGVPEEISWMELFKVINEIIIKKQYVDELLGANFTVLDIGANTGVFSILGANRCREGMIYAFEPKLETFLSLKMNASFYKNIKVFQMALGDQSGKKDLVRRNTDSVSNTILDSELMKFDTRDVLREEVQMTTIDQFVERHNLNKVDFIKVDTEGYEKNVIRGGRNTIKRFKPIVVVSAYHLPDDIILLPKIMRSISPDYRCKLLKRAEKVFLFY